MTLLDRIAEIIEETDKTARSLSVEAGLSPRFIADLQAGVKKSFSSRSAQKFAETHGYSVEWIQYGTGPKKPGATDSETAEILHVGQRIRDKKLRDAWLDMGRAIIRDQNEEERR